MDSANKVSFFSYLTIVLLLSGGYTLKYKANALEWQQAKEQWFFKAISGYPVSITFEPVVLFENGEYVEVGTQPIASVDKEVSKRNRPKAWGHWELKGDSYHLTDHKGKAHDFNLGSGNWFPAFPYQKTVALARLYKNTSSIDVGLGTTLAISQITFLDGEHFIEGENMGTLTPSASAWKKSTHTGIYQIEDHTITLTFSNGKQEKRSFAVSAKGNPAMPNPRMIFIGGDAYLAEK